MRAMRAIVVAFIMAVAVFAACPVGAADPCLGCHRQKTPGIVGYWERSAHPGKDVGCAGCHGTDVEASHRGDAVVDADVCGRCHEAAYASHRLGKHAVSLKTGQGCTRNMPQSAERDRSCELCHRPGSAEPFVNTECAMFLAQSPEMRRRGCGACHRVETGCDSCHTKHGTDLGLASSAEACGTCHMGPDHAQYEMWRSSAHGVIYGRTGAGDAPTCVTCHMDGGSHNVSRGIATGRSPEAASSEREFMVGICSRCHTGAFSGRSLSDADAIEAQSRGILDEARQIVEALGRDGLLKPDPGERPGHPLFGKGLVIGPHMLYEDISRAEAIYFRMMMFYYMSAFKGAFHQNPDYSHWFGNAPLKLSLSELKTEAALLRDIRVIEQGAGKTGAGSGGETSGLIGRLRELEALKLRGLISEEEYTQRKKALLDESGL